MINKQINGVKYVEKADGTFLVTTKEGGTVKYPKETGLQQYRLALATYKTDSVMEKCLKEVGLTVETAHLYGDDKQLKLNETPLSYRYPTGIVTKTPSRVFCKRLEKALRQEQITLPYMATDTKKYGIHIGGNTEAIAWSLMWYLWHGAWVEVQLTRQELMKYFKTHPNINVYQSSKDDYVLVPRERLLKTQFGMESRHRGYGSQASIVTETVKLKKDKKGNLLIDKLTEIWD